jgi:EAL domain-containing protein (putative c-di-GMP-specific phosphodiesterase class I)
LDCSGTVTGSTARNALDRAFAEKNLLLVYQPIHDARSGAIVAAEALMRQRRENGELREAHIISDAAEEGSERDLFAFDQWMLRTAIADAADWPIALNVNLSPREFVEGDVLERFEKLAGRRLNLEITETLTIEEPERAVDVLASLKKLGFGLWLDDFGSGHSTLEQLLHFPVDGIKIAATFIENLPHDARAAAITRSLIDVAHDLHIEVLAEGVERNEQLRFLIEHGCEFVQRFFFSRPMRREELDGLLRTSRAT